MAFVGDLMLGRKISRRLHQHPPTWFWGDTLPLLRAADAVFANLESPITASDRRWRRTWKMFHFKADPQAIDLLTQANVRFVCLANNHVLDYEAAGLLDTIAALDRANIAHAGAGRDRTEASSPRILEVAGTRIGVIAGTDGMPEFAAKDHAAGTHSLDFGVGSDALDWVDRSVGAMRDAGVALTVLSVHWGPNMRRRPPDHFRRFAKDAIDRGVDILHGHSAHVVQGVERYRNGVILYDTGNLLDDYWKFPFRNTHWSFVFRLAVEASRPLKLTMVPVLTHPLPPTRATGEVCRQIKNNMRSLCAAVGTSVTDTGEGLEVALR